MKQVHHERSAGSGAGGAVLERLFEVGVLLSDGMDQELTQRGLTRARAELIWRLRRGGPKTQRALSQLLGCTPRNVTGLVDALEASGFAARSPHPTDRRATIVSLTKSGSAIAAQMEAGYRATAESLFADLKPTELSAFAATLDRVLLQLRQPNQRESVIA